MKVLFINDYLERIGGAESYCYSLMSLLIQRGDHVKLIGGRKKRSILLAYIIATLNFPFCLKILREIKKFRPHIIHFNNIFNNIPPILLLMLRYYNIPLVLTVHGIRHYICPQSLMLYNNEYKCSYGFGSKCLTTKCNPKSNFILRLLNFLRVFIHREIIKRSIDVYICPSNSILIWMNRMIQVSNAFLLFPFIKMPEKKIHKIARARVEKSGVSNNKFCFIPNGFNPNLFYNMDKTEVKQKLNLPLDKKIILNVANLYPVKGQKYLIDAMKYIVKYRKDVLCVIVGDGMLRKDLKEQIKKLGLKNYIKLVGSKPHDEIPLWMNAADLFVLSSLSEGCPIVMLEALGTALPFIGTRVGGVPEIINSVDYGLLCEPTNTKDLADKLLIGLDKEWNREKILKYAQKFTWNNISKEIIEIYVRARRLV